MQHTITTIDYHTGGEPLRIITSGFPLLRGQTILERRAEMKTHHDHLRRMIIHEPRGHADMYGAIITPPVSAQADFGVLFLHNEGYSTMCGHGIIALGTMAVETGMVTPQIPETRVGIDTPAGFIEAFVGWDGTKVGTVRFLNVPSFLYLKDLVVTTPNFGEVVVDVAFGGAFYAYLDAAAVGLSVTPRDLDALIQAGDEIKKAVEQVKSVVHPLEAQLTGIYGTILAGPPADPVNTQSNVCIFADREVDRSPTGTGTAGRVAQLFARGRLALHEPILNESIVGSVFRGQAVQTTTVGDYAAIIPEVSGTAHLTGYHTFVIDSEDPLARGFSLRSKEA